MKFIVRGEDQNGIFYTGLNGLRSIETRFHVPYDTFDEAHDRVEEFRHNVEFQGIVEVIPHPEYEHEPKWTFLFLGLTAGFIFGLVATLLSVWIN